MWAIQPQQHRRAKERVCLCITPALTLLVFSLETAMVQESASESKAMSSIRMANQSEEGKRSTAEQNRSRVGSLAGNEINADGYTSARVCGSCHVDIYRSWKNSLHAFSLTDPIFDAAYMQALKESPEAKQLCLRCHAPMTMFNGDYDLSLGVTREGVSCDFCHTVTAVHLDSLEHPYSLEPGLVKRSVLRKANSPRHEVAYSELHAKAEFCGGCHNFTNNHGVPVMSTYTEWKNGPYPAEGTQCQNCHMALSEGHVVSQEVKKSRSNIHLHSLIHDSEQLRSALKVAIDRAERRPHGLELEVVVRNVGSGHMVPTGMPSREVVLRVEVKSGARKWKDERRYKKVVSDSQGQTLLQDHEVLLHGKRIVSDNRIAPREERREVFHFVVPDESVTVTVTADYVYSPMLLQRREMQIELDRTERTIF